MVVIRSREKNINGDQNSRKQPAAISPHVEEMARLVIAEGGSTCEESVAIYQQSGQRVHLNQDQYEITCRMCCGWKPLGCWN